MSTKSILALFSAGWWGVGIFLLTFLNTFTGTSNGYFAVCVAFSRCRHRRHLAKAQGVRAVDDVVHGLITFATAVIVLAELATGGHLEAGGVRGWS